MATQANPFAVGTAQPQQTAGQLPPNPVQQPPQNRAVGGGGYNPGKPAPVGGGNYNPGKPAPAGLGVMNDPDRMGGNVLNPGKPAPVGLGVMNDPDRSGGNYNPGKPAPTQLGGPTGPQVKPPPNRSFIAQDLMKQFGLPPQMSQKFAQDIANTQAMSDALFSQYGTDRAALERDPRFIKLQQQSQQLDREMGLARQRFGNQNPGKPAPLNANQMAWNQEAAMSARNKQLLG